MARKLDEKDLLDLKARIDEAKTNVATLNGQLDYVMQELKEKHHVGSLKEAEAKLKELEGWVDGIQVEIDTGIAQLEADYGL